MEFESIRNDLIENGDRIETHQPKSELQEFV